MRNRRIAVVACVGVFCALIVRSAPAAALPGERQLLAVPSIGTHPPGGGDLTSISKFTLGPSGSLVVSANWRVPSGGGVLNGGGAWLLDGGVLTEVAREDGEVSGFPGYVYSFLSSVGSGKSGEALVSAELFSVLSAPRTVGLWRVRSGQSELLLQMDAAAPGLSDGSLLGGGNASNSAFDFGAIDRFGRTVVKTAIHGPAVDPNVNGSIAYWFDGSSFQKILRTGDLVDGVSSPVTSMSARFTSREGRSVFSVSTGVSSQSRHVFEFDGAALAPVIIDRTAAPGLGGLLFVSPSAQAMSPGGTIAIYSGLTGPSAQNSAIWRRVDGVISLAARESQTIASPAGWTMRAIGQRDHLTFDHVTDQVEKTGSFQQCGPDDLPGQEGLSQEWHPICFSDVPQILQLCFRNDSRNDNPHQDLHQRKSGTDHCQDRLTTGLVLTRQGDSAKADQA